MIIFASDFERIDGRELLSVHKGFFIFRNGAIFSSIFKMVI